ncbi:MAG: Cephalosporin-C deacetylase [Verrucomicrobiae bacterium]|nr:Cephalosporin-C deacetylase [Verrucomicrobiae bacterium]
MSFHHNFPFDPTYGYHEQKLRIIKAPVGPADFIRFWEFTYAAARRVPLRLARRQIASPNPQFALYEIEFDSLDCVRIGGWITVPADGKFRRGVVVGHGYGGREAPDFDLPPPAAVAIFPCARGFHRSARGDIPADASRHVLHGIEDKDTYVHRGCVADVWGAASALLELYPGAARHLHYHGGSFGGGIGALALPWDNRFHKAFLDVPSFGQHPLRLIFQCTGSGEAVRLYAKEHPEVIDVLQYFDAATAARHIKIPVLVAAALFDPAVPPPGQFAVFNALPVQKELFVRRAAHFEWAGQAHENDDLSTRLWQWFS